MALPYCIVIPARYASSRLPGKPLRDVAGKPLIQRVWESAVKAQSERVVVATDDGRIAEVVSAFGGEVCMTSATHVSGTDRLAEVAGRLGFADDALLVNLQGDEPCVPVDVLDSLAQALAESDTAGISTVATQITCVEDLFDPNVVKVVRDRKGLARYFSRAPIPWVRDAFQAGPPQELPAGVPFLRHLGLYCYRVATLKAISELPTTEIEIAEALEQLRALEQGIGIQVSIIPTAPAYGVDTESDLARAQRYFAGAA